MYDSKQPTNDEKQIKEFMVAKYEKKMYYTDPVSQKSNDGFQTKPTASTVTSNYQVNIILNLKYSSKHFLSLFV